MSDATQCGSSAVKFIVDLADRIIKLLNTFPDWPLQLFALNSTTKALECKGLITMNPVSFDNDFSRVTIPTDGFVGMVRKDNSNN